MFGLVVSIKGNVMPARQLLICLPSIPQPSFNFFKKKLDLEQTNGPIQGDCILRNAHRNAHTSAGHCAPGSAVRHHQLSAHLEKSPKGHQLVIKDLQT